MSYVFHHHGYSWLILSRPPSRKVISAQTPFLPPLSPIPSPDPGLARHQPCPPALPSSPSHRTLCPGAVAAVGRRDGAAAARLVRPVEFVEPSEAVLELPVLLDLLPDHQRRGDGVADGQHQEQDAQRQHLTETDGERVNPGQRTATD